MYVESIGISFLITAAAIFTFALVKAYFELRRLEKQSKENKKLRVKSLLDLAKRLPPDNLAKKLLDGHAIKLSGNER